MGEIKILKVLSSSGSYNEYDISAVQTEKLGSSDVGSSTSPIYLSEGSPVAIDLLNTIYPIGSVYFSVNNTNPSSTFGGTWEAYGDANSYLRLGGTGTGGSNSVTLTTANLPSHNHSFTGSAVTSNGPSNNTTGTQSANHTHSMQSHTHTTSMTFGSSGAHEHVMRINWENNYGHTIGYCMNVAGGGAATYFGYLGIDGNKTHNIQAGSSSHSHSTTATSGGPSSGSTGSNSANHTHSMQSHTHSVTAAGTIGNTGSGTAVTVEPKYVQVYAWKRTA